MPDENKKTNSNRKTKNGSVLLESLPPAEKERLQPYVEVTEVRESEFLAELDKPIEYVWFPHNCVTSTVVITDDGSFLEVGLMGAEGMVGLSLLFGEETSNTTVIAQIPGIASRMRASDFQKEVVAKAGPLFQIIQRYCNGFTAMLAQSAVCNTEHSLHERMCKWLLMTHDRVQEDYMRLTHKFLSMMLGVRRPEVSLTAGALKQAGLIDFTRESVTIKDRKGLEEGSCECYGIIYNQLYKVFHRDWRRINRHD